MKRIKIGSVMMAMTWLAASALFGAPAAEATPGMLNARGCHGHPRHCHSRSEWRTNRRGRHYIAGHFYRD